MARYIEENGCTYEEDDDGNKNLLANFIARIVKETRYVDGINTEATLTIEGERANPDKSAEEHIKLPAVEVEAVDFPSMSWVTQQWGIQCVIRPGSGIKDHLRTCIQLASNPEIRTVYKHIGWTAIAKEMVYLHAAGGITKKGNDPTVEVRLPNELGKYNLLSTAKPIEAVRASLGLVRIASPEITWPLLAATVAPLFGQVDFATHLTGRTGTFKSELMSLFQSHYGAEMDSRHLPGSWSSTPNALEAQAFFAANAVFVIDDFVPQGSPWQQKSYQTAADKVIRAQGNQAGRGRMTDTSRLQTAMFPRGIIMSTGEDTPEGHSVRARLFIFELSPGDIKGGKGQPLANAQDKRAMYPATIAALARHIAEKRGVDLRTEAKAVRDQNLEIGHTRTPAMVGLLVASIHYFLDWAELIKAITPADSKKLFDEAKAAIVTAGAKQQSYLEAADPVDMFLSAIRATIASGKGHFRSMNGGAPKNAVMLGWTSESGMDDMEIFKKRGQPIGWVDWSKNEMYLDAAGGLPIVLKDAGKGISWTQPTLLKRLKESGKLARTDSRGNRNTVRIMAEGHSRTVIALKLGSTLDTQEAPSDDE